MKCYNHPDAEAVATCVLCGKAICQNCSVDVAGRISCQRCLSSGNAANLQIQPVKPTNALAIVSLILGVLGLCGGLIFSIAAWVTGHLAQKQILENPNQEGLQLASAGKILGIVITAIYGALIACYILFVFITLLLALIPQGSY
jgi:hypothetical protein